VDSYKEFMPRRMDVMVGGKKLVVREFNAAKRDAIVRMVVDDLDLGAAGRSFSEAVARFRESQEGEEPGAEKVGAVFQQMRGIVKKVLGRDLTSLMCVTLDVAENREAVGLGKEKIEEHPQHRFRHCPAMWRWVEDNLLLRNEPEIVKAIVEVNDFSTLVKNWSTLVADLAGAAGEESEETIGQASD